MARTDKYNNENPGNQESEADHLATNNLEYEKIYDNPKLLAQNLVAIDDRISSFNQKEEDILFLYTISEYADVDEGLSQYSTDLLNKYQDNWYLEEVKEELEVFEEYRNPLEFSKEFLLDLGILAENSSYGDTGIEFFGRNSEDIKKEATLKSFELMRTNIGREMVINFMKYKPRGPFWDIAGASYGFCKGLRMELEEKDLEERLSEVAETLEEK